MIENPLLLEVLNHRVVRHPDGREFKLTSASSRAECEVIYRLVRERKPDTVLEIGMAYGVSALTILEALRANGKGRLISVDPYPDWNSAKEIALSLIEQSNLSEFHEHMHEPSELALPEMYKAGLEVQFAYIDGHHSFDHAFIDVFYCDRMMEKDAIIAIDDSAWKSVNRVIRFLLSNRKYTELEVGLPRSFKSSVPIVGGIIKRLEGRFGPSRYFQKNEEWRPPYNFYARF